MANGGTSSADLQASVVREPTGWKASGAWTLWGHVQSSGAHVSPFALDACVSALMVVQHYCSSCLLDAGILWRAAGGHLCFTRAGEPGQVQHHGSLRHLPSLPHLSFDMLPQKRRSLGMNQALPDLHFGAIPPCCRPGVAWTCCA